MEVFTKASFLRTSKIVEEEIKRWPKWKQDLVEEYIKEINPDFEPTIEKETIVMSKWKLCYVDDNFAYFTTQELSEQQGDDWDDVPYVNNAGEPYYPKEGDDWEILKVAYEGRFSLPHEDFSIECAVEHINSGIVAWLSTSKFETPEHGYISIRAGVPLYEFIELIKKGGGQVYIPLKEEFDLKDCYRGCANDK